MSQYLDQESTKALNFCIFMKSIPQNSPSGDLEALSFLKLATLNGLLNPITGHLDIKLLTI